MNATRVNKLRVRTTIVVVAILAFSALVAYFSLVSKAHADQRISNAKDLIQDGMTPLEVARIVGTSPDESLDGGDGTLEEWWHGNEISIVVHFDHNRAFAAFLVPRANSGGTGLLDILRKVFGSSNKVEA